MVATTIAIVVITLSHQLESSYASQNCHTSALPQAANRVNAHHLHGRTSRVDVITDCRFGSSSGQTVASPGVAADESNKRSGRLIAQDEARGFDASDRVGEGCGQPDDPPIDCRVWVGFFSPYFGRGCKRMPYAPPCWNQTKSSGRLIAKDAARGFDASDRVGEGRGQPDEPPIDCRVSVGFFSPHFARGCKRMPYAPPCWNHTKWSGRLIAKDAARGFDASDRVGEGGGRQYEPPIDCCVWVGLFPPHFARSMKNYVIRPPLLELNRFEQTPRRPG